MNATLDQIAADRVRRALNRPGAYVEEVGEFYAVRTSPDRRRPFILRFEEPLFRELVATPGLRPRREGGWSPARAWEEPEPAQAGRPGAIEGEKVVMESGGSVTRRANLGANAVAWLARRRDADGRPWLTPAQVAAAERLQEDHRRSGLIGRLTMDWSGQPRSGASSSTRGNPLEHGLTARRRVEAAMAAVSAELRPVLDRLCLRELALADVERELGIAARGARPLLQRALDQLARYYGIG